ncbi:MAG: hypothetical protein HYU33_05720 [Candidatus Omnitrophica bacterium]|nr:hypothetical protein [Candidatus Omnitrophota bacterium]
MSDVWCKHRGFNPPCEVYLTEVAKEKQDALNRQPKAGDIEDIKGTPYTKGKQPKHGDIKVTPVAKPAAKQKADCEAGGGVWAGEDGKGSCTPLPGPRKK